MSSSAEHGIIQSRWQAVRRGEEGVRSESRVDLNHIRNILTRRHRSLAEDIEAFRVDVLHGVAKAASLEAEARYCGVSWPTFADPTSFTSESRCDKVI
ncbi:unnamed protein product [Protopolystoma xenopodis]|uniref:Uncharacterized protein n=1 Tax=Protopolystoma xenopodis TaxID=117903 RepID=A0A448XIQ0_9PLAT|nr:unnamed protein product [Protopolystoma xenopodis]